MKEELPNPVFIASNINNSFKIYVQNYMGFLNNNEGRIEFIIEKNLCDSLCI